MSTPSGSYQPVDTLPVNAVVRPPDPSGTARLSSSLSLGIGPEGTASVLRPATSLHLNNGSAYLPNMTTDGDYFTLEAWVRVQSTGAIFSGTGGNHCSAWRLVLNADGALEVWIDGFPFRRATSLPSDLPLSAWMDQWHHVAVVSAGKTWVYVDGVPKGYAEVVVGGPAFVGVVAGSGPPPITADFNEVRYWFRNLYQAEIDGNLHAPIVAGNSLGCVYGLEEGRFDDRLGGRSMQPSGTWSWSVLRPYGDGWIQAR